MPRSAATAQPPTSAAAQQPASYEHALTELDALVQQMESGHMPLDQLLTAYKRGAVLLDYCRERLRTVEDQVKVLEDGQLKSWGNT